MSTYPAIVATLLAVVGALAGGAFPQAARAAGTREGLVLEYRFEGSAADSSGGKCDGAMHGRPQFVPGKVGQCVQLDGQQDYIDSGTTLGLLGMFVLLVPLVIELTVRLARRAPRLILPLAAFALLGGLLFLLPYLLWLYSSLPGIAWATGFALAIAAAVLAAAFLTLRRPLQQG